MKAYLSLGNNLGNREEMLDKAVSLVGEKAGRVLKRSSFYYSEPWGFRSKNSFVNIVILIDTHLSPTELLHATQEIEFTLGRRKKSNNGVYEDRLIDIDILTYEDMQIQTEELTLPHPLMLERDFVMIPLKEIQEK